MLQKATNDGHRTTQFGDEINRGERYPAFYDRPHLLNVGLIYKSKKRFSFSAKQYLSSGRNFTYDYLLPVTLVSSKNEIRLPMYHRLDLAVHWEYQNIKHPNRQSILSISIYNAYNHLNTYMVVKSLENNRNRGEYESVTFFPIIPSITYGFRF